MKKIVILFVFFSFIICIYVDYIKSSSYKVMKVVSPREIYIDFNRNFILDEKKPFFVNNLFDISDVKEMVDNQKKLFFPISLFLRLAIF